MGWARQKSQTSSEPPASSPAAPPELARRRQNRRSTIRAGRTIGEQREQLEKASERQAKHKKSEHRKRVRIFFVSLGFIIIAVCLVALYVFLVHRDKTMPSSAETATVYEPTIQIIDEDSAAVGTKVELSDRMRNYIGQAEADFRDLGYTPTKAILPSGSIREVDFYLKDQPGYIKLHLDRGTAESVEDADRLIRYLKAQGTTTFEYLDVRLSGKAYWK